MCTKTLFNVPVLALLHFHEHHKKIQSKEINIGPLKLEKRVEKSCGIQSTLNYLYVSAQNTPQTIGLAVTVW